MSLTNEDKQVLTQLHIDKCRSCLADGEQLLALLVANGIYSKSHHGTNAQFHQHFIKTGIIDPKYGHFIAVMENMREKADYDVIYDVSREDLDALKPIAYELIEQIENLLNTK